MNLILIQIDAQIGVLIATDYALYVIQTFWGIRVKFVSAMVLDIPVRALHVGPDPTIEILLKTYVKIC